MLKHFSGSVESDTEDFSSAKIQFSAEINSIQTGNTDRGNHLKSADFFAAAEFPHLTFESQSFEKISDDTYKLTGALTIRGNT